MCDLIFYIVLLVAGYFGFQYIQSLWLHKKLDQFTADKCPKDVVIMHGTERMRNFNIPSPSPFVLKLETFLRMAKIPYEYDGTLKNTFGPKGKTPWISLNGEHIADSQLCVEFLTKKFNPKLPNNYSPREKAIAKVVRLLFEEHVFWEFVLWLWVWGGPGIEAVLKMGVPWIGAKYMSWNYKKLAWAQGMGRHERKDVEAWSYQDIDTVSTILGENKFLLGDEPCVEDATVFGFCAQFFWGCLQTSEHARVTKEKYPNIQAYCERIKERYFPDWDELYKKTK